MSAIKDEFIEVPITRNFDLQPKSIVGLARILISALPEKPDWILSLGYKMDENRNYELIELSIIHDSKFISYADSEKG